MIKEEKKTGEATQQGAFPQQMVSTRLEALWMPLFSQGMETQSLASTEQLPPAYLPTTNLQFAMPLVLPCSPQTMEPKTCNFPLKQAAFQVEVEGLNFLFHLNHMHKAVIVTAEITAAFQSPGQD